MNREGYRNPTEETAIRNASRKVWTREEEQRLIYMQQEQFTVREMAERLEVTRKQLHKKMEHLREQKRIPMSDMQLSREWRKECMRWKEILTVPELQQRLIEYQADPLVQSELKRYRREELKQRG